MTVTVTLSVWWLVAALLVLACWLGIRRPTGWDSLYDRPTALVLVLLAGGIALGKALA